MFLLDLHICFDCSSNNLDIIISLCSFAEYSKIENNRKNNKIEINISYKSVTKLKITIV